MGEATEVSEMLLEMLDVRLWGVRKEAEAPHLKPARHTGRRFHVGQSFLQVLFLSTRPFLRPP